MRLDGFALLLALAALAACAEPPAPQQQRALPRRIVVMAPAAAEMLDALSALDGVVGIGDFVREPPAITGLPRIGSYDSPNVERVLDLEADLVVTAGSEAAEPAHRRLESLGVRVLALDTATYDGIFTALAELGAAVGRPDAAAEVARKIRADLASIASDVRGLPRPAVLFVVGREPLFVAGPGSHVDEMITLAGGSNIAHDGGSPYPRMSVEAILERAPEIIIDTSDNRPGARRGRNQADWARFEFLPAVRDDRVFSVDPERLVIPGIRLPEMTRLLARLLHPEVFGEASDSELGPRSGS